MPRGSKQGEWRGGRGKGTPNKSTALKKAALSAASADPTTTPLQFLLGVMRDPTAHGDHGSSCPGDRGYLPRPWTGLAASQCRSRQSRPVEGDVGDRELPHGGSRRPCHALRGLLAHADRL